MQLTARFMRQQMAQVVKLNFVEQRRFYEERVLGNPLAAIVAQEYFELEGLRACWFLPQEIKSPGTLVYWHGGGYCIGSINTHQELISRIAKESGCKTLAVDYRLAPEHPYPAALEDALMVMRYLRENGHDPKQTVLAGDSAGGNLSIVTILALIEKGEPVPSGCAALSPWVDMLSTRKSVFENAPYDYVGPHFDAGWRQAYATTEQIKDPLVSPIYADYNDFPPLLLHAGGAETLRDEIAYLAERVEKMGVDLSYREWPGMIHVWHSLASIIPEAKEAIAELGIFVKHHTSASQHKK